MAWDDLTESEKGYVAGFFDGEGSVTYTTCNDRIYPVVCFYNTNKPVIEWIANIFGEFATHRTEDKRRVGKNLDNYAVYIKKTRDVKDVLECLLPYLRIKRNQAVQTIEFLDWKLERMNHRRTEEEKEVEIMHKESIQKLNRGRSY